ncbi:MAG: cytochrome c [Balneolaceae bacterium]
MKKVLRYILFLLGILLLLAASGLAYIKIMLPDVGPPPDITVEMTDENIERGKYLANHVMLCMDCHAMRDWSLYAGPPMPGTEGAGGEVFDQSMNFPGRFISRNLTPAMLGEWTDGEIFRAITTGVSRDGSALFPVMPYTYYGQLDEEDIKSVIAYLRTLEPIENELEVSKPDFPFNFIINTIPREADLKPRLSSENTLEYGKYLTTAAACSECHTKQVQGQVVGEPFAGGFEFTFPNGDVVRSANITPHETGIGNMTKEQFVQRFKTFADSSYVSDKVEPRQFQTVMPWLMYADMKSEDLEAIYEYLRTVDPVGNTVVRFTAAE